MALVLNERLNGIELPVLAQFPVLSPEVVDVLYEEFGKRTGIGVNLIDPKPNNSDFPVRTFTQPKPKRDFPIRYDSLGNYARLPFAHQNFQ